MSAAEGRGGMASAARGRLSGRAGALAAATVLVAGGTQCLGQANFHEAFDDLGPPSFEVPAALIQRGWIFRNQSEPLGTRHYRPGTLPSTNPAYFWPQAGTGYLAVDEGATGAVGTISAWAILPPVPNQIAGDEISLWVRRRAGVSQVEVRYSATGGTDTGTSVSDVGDFAHLLMDIAPTDSGWMRHSAGLPGSGRIALRYRADWYFGNFSPYTGIDTLSVGPPPPPACNQPPIPDPGQTFHWTAANSPYRICQDVTIPTGATVNVEPGVVVNIDSGRQLVVAGSLNINGTAADPVVFAAPGNFPPFVKVQQGMLSADFADFGQQLRISSGANVQLRDCTFTSDGSGHGGGMLISDAPSYVLLERCTFTQTFCTLSDTIAVLRGNTFIETSPSLLRGYADVTAPNVLIGGKLQITREESIQPLPVDGIAASGNANGAGLGLSGGNYLLGPATNLQNNLYALDLGGGLLPGSAVPATGNANDVINVGTGSFGGFGRWSNVGLPYRITEPSGSLPGGQLTIDPGVTVEAGPGVPFVFRSTRRLIADGLPGAPITFTSALPGDNWQGMIFQTNSSEGSRLEYCTIEGANIGLVSSDNLLYVENSIIQTNALGATAGSFGQINYGNTRFQGNNAGLTNRGQVVSNANRPNTIAGNIIGIDAVNTGAMNAAHVWWGSPSGPQHPNNPGGTGDVISGPGAGGVSFMPFLTAAPNFADHPPVVRLLEPGLAWHTPARAPDYFLEPGSKIIIHWEAHSAIVSQRILFSPDGHYPDRFTLIADELPGAQRSYEWTVPDPGFAVTNQPQFVRIVAIDDAGREGWDQTPLMVSSGRVTGDLAITSSFAGQTFSAGSPMPSVTFSGSASNFATVEVFMVLEADGHMIMAPFASNGQAQFFGSFPMISTDAARLAIRARNNSNDVAWFFADHWFSIRHDLRLGFTPPDVQVVSPAHGTSFPGGGTVPITWTASATEVLYSFDIQASFTSGRTWHLIARDLPAAARTFNWQLPDSTGIPEVRIRIIARDLRFQNSSSGHYHSITISPGSGPQPCYANCDGSTTPPVLNVEDFTCFVSEFAAGLILPAAQQVGHYANCDGSTVIPVLNVDDFTCFINSFAQGCP
jgi:hypothetical protein